MAVEGGVNPLTVSKAYQELVDLQIVEKRRGLGMFITPLAQKELLKLEKDKFLKGEWPLILKRADQLNINLTDLLKKR
jgi:GntR family transcriptional regulator